MLLLFLLLLLPLSLPYYQSTFESRSRILKPSTLNSSPYPKTVQCLSADLLGISREEGTTLYRACKNKGMTFPYPLIIPRVLPLNPCSIFLKVCPPEHINSKAMFAPGLHGWGRGRSKARSWVGFWGLGFKIYCENIGFRAVGCGV